MNIDSSENLRSILVYSRQEAERLHYKVIAPEHFLLGIIRHGKCQAAESLRAMGVNLTELKELIESRCESDGDFVPNQSLALSPEAENVLRMMYLESRTLKSPLTRSEHLLLGILKEGHNLGHTVLGEQQVDYFKLRKLLEQKQPQVTTDEFANDEDVEDEFPSGGSESRTAEAIPTSNNNTPALDKFGIDLTRAAAEGKLDPVVGREVEMQRVIEILSRRKKNNPILIGEPGVGKTAIVEGLANRIAKHKVPRQLHGRRIVSLDMASVVAGTKYRGQFEERIKAILNEMSQNPNIILFIDEIHTIIGAGSASGSLDAANMLKPALARGELQCIGATTLDEFRKTVEKDGALDRRFQKVVVEPTSKDDTLAILKNIKGKYENFHHVIYTDAALEACVHLTDRYITDRCFPDKAIDAMDETGSRVKTQNSQIPDEIKNIEDKIREANRLKIAASESQNYEVATEQRDLVKQLESELAIAEKKYYTEQKLTDVEITEDDVAETVAFMTGVPTKRVAQSESAQLRHLEDTLNKQVIGQEEAIHKIVKSIQRNRVGLKDPNKPIGSFIFLGPTGVGKTLLAKVLSEEMFDNRDALIRIDMSEYLEKFSVSRLIGAPPGYVGHEDGGQLTEQVRRHPYSVVLLDEIEKAHPDVYNLLLQVLDEGRLTDSLGRMVDFKNTIIIMTSNVGTRQLREFGTGVGFTAASRDEQAIASSMIQKSLNRQFSPEFLNRIDDIIVFNAIGKAEIDKIIDIEIGKLKQRLQNYGVEILLTPAARQFLADHGLDEKNGARPLNRAIRKYVEDPLTDYLLEHTNKHNKIKFDVAGETLKIIKNK